MAVKDKKTTSTVIFDFLSRLCGGEGPVAANQSSTWFLSRLCGGEVAAVITTVAACFLSRLCGGEAHVRHPI